MTHGIIQSRNNIGIRQTLTSMAVASRISRDELIAVARANIQLDIHPAEVHEFLPDLT